MFEPRPEEPDYAFVPEVDHPEKNRYGKTIETVPANDELRGKSLNINGEQAVSDNPNRYKQHGFYFNADNCISCHACEAACSEKNDLPAHIAFRSVGYVEGGSYPAYQRMNISMACNHCDDPVCLKGCPTRAYTKFAEYGAVLQDPDICFGCGYCTWVCPYNAPQLDPVAGHVSKCNMCVDRLEVGLKPACSSACLAGALDFGIIETKPDNRDQLETQIPGFPTPEITHPNIRFQQTRSLPREMTRPDSMPLRYTRVEQGDQGIHTPEVDHKQPDPQWGLKKLSTRENPLVVFTLATQTVVGAFIALFIGPMFGLPLPTPESHPVAWPMMLFTLIGLETVGLVLSTLHLGRPHRFYRAFNNLRHSPVSREVAGVAIFYNMLGLYTLVKGIPPVAALLPGDLAETIATLSGWGAVISGIAALYFMHRIYRIPARPYWDHWQVLTSFYGNMLTLGSLFAGVIATGLAVYSGETYSSLMSVLSIFMVTGLALESFGLWRHAADMGTTGGEAAAGDFVQRSTFGKTWRARNVGLAASIVLITLLAATAPEGGIGLVLWLLATMLVAITATASRAIFYAVVVPTTMPGAFFWRNKGFEEHARESGLADMPQAGIAPAGH